MKKDNISLAIEKTRRNMANRKKQNTEIFMDGIVTPAEMKKLKENFDEAYYDISVLREMLGKQQDSLMSASDKTRDTIESQISALKDTEKLVFENYCNSVLSLQRAHKMRRQAMSHSSKSGRKLLKVQLSPEELALLYGVINSTEELRTKGTPEQQLAAEQKIQKVVRLIRKGERNKKVLLEILQNTR